MSRFVAVSILCALLGGCAYFKDTPANDKAAVCNQLKHRMMFNAATPNQTLATQERGQMDKLSQNYHDEDCD